MRFFLDMDDLMKDPKFKELWQEFARVKLALVTYFNEKVDFNWLPKTGEKSEDEK